MRFGISFAAFAAFLSPTLAQGPGAHVYNLCSFPISFYGDAANQGTDVNGTIWPGGHYEESWKASGRALKFWRFGMSPVSLLVWGYTADESSPFVW